MVSELVRVVTGDAGGAVDEDEDHAAEGPGDAEEANAVTGATLFLVANDGGYSDIQEKKSGYELSDEGSVESPQPQLRHVNERSRWWVHVVLPMVLCLPFLTHFLRHSLSMDQA